MARTRQLKPDFFADEDISALTPIARLLFMGLWLIADKAGRLEDRPLRIRAALFPYEPDTNVEAALASLSKEKVHGLGAFIVRYAAADGRKYIQISNFEKHQHCHPKELPSTIPGNSGTSPVKQRQGLEIPAPAGTKTSVPSVPSESVPSGPSAAVDNPGPSRQTNVPLDDFLPAAWEEWRTRRGGGALEPSSAEFVLARLWWSDGIPLRVVCTAIRECGGKPGETTPLTYAGPAVTAEWSRVSAGRSA
jgi:hypothetical protein